MDSDDRTEQVQWLESEAADAYDCCQADVSDYNSVWAFAEALAADWEEQSQFESALPEWYGEHDYGLMIEMIANMATT